MANKTLTAKVKFETKSAEQSLNRLARKIKDVQTAMNRTTRGNNQLNTAIKKAVTSTNKLNTATQRVANTTKKVVTANAQASNAARKLGNHYNTANKSANTLLGTVKRLAATYLGIQGGRIVIGASDTITSTQNKLNNLEGGNPQTTAESMDKIYAASQRSRSNYGDMLSNVSKTMTLAGDSFQGNIDNAIRFQEIMAKAYSVGGASATEASTSMYQLVQALGSGVLQGDELRSVREGAPIAYKQIEKFAQGVFNTEESLKDMASQGVITSDIIVAAIMDAEKDITKSFENTQMTFGQAWDNIKSMALKAFEPALESLNKMLNKFAESGGLEAIGNILVWLGNAVSGLFSVMGSFFGWCADNWSWLSQVIIFAVITMCVYLTYLASTSVISAIKATIAWVALNWQLILIIGTISLVIYAFYAIANGATAAGKVILTILAIVGIAMAVILFPKFVAWLSYLAFAIKYYAWLGVTALKAGIQAAIAWAIANWQMALIILVIVAIVAAVIWLADSFSDAIGMILGLIMSGLALTWNIFAGFINAIIQSIWSYFVEPIAGIIEWVVNAFNGGFDSIGGAFANLCGQLLSMLIGLVKPFTQILDTLFGWDTTGAIESAQESMKNWGKNENAVTYKLEAPQLQRWAYEDAYATGHSWGTAAGDWIADKTSGLTSGFNLGAMGSSQLPDMNDPALALGNSYDPSGIADDIAKGKDILGNIDDNTKMTDDDIDYLRKLAQTEWKNEFTTAEIKVAMTNHNNVNSERDLDGIVEYLSDVLREEMSNVAYGVHY